MNWKSIFVAALILGAASAPLSAQGLMDKLASQACDCISKQDVDNMPKDEIQMQLSFCIMEAIGANQAAFEKEMGSIDPSDQAAMAKLGEQIGMKMAFKCPQVLMKVADVQTQAQAAPTPAALEEMSGTIRSVGGDEVGIITLQDEQGRTHKLLWLRYFKGSEPFINSPSEMVGKKVKVKVEAIEAYSPKAKDYYNRKEVREVVILQ